MHNNNNNNKIPSEFHCALLEPPGKDKTLFDAYTFRVHFPHKGSHYIPIQEEQNHV